MKNRCLCVFFLVLYVHVPFFAELFQFKYTEGAAYTVETETFYDVFTDGKYTESMSIAEKTFFTVSDVSDGKAVHTAVSVDIPANTRHKKAPPEEKAVFIRDESGIFTVDTQTVLPTVRNMPVFPAYDVQIGDSWVFMGEEIHGFDGSFTLEPLKIPVAVQYTYLAAEEHNGQILHKILMRYKIQHTNTVRPSSRSKNYLLNITGTSEKILYWNNDKGLPEHITEKFTMVFRTLHNVTIEYTGESASQLSDYMIPPEPVIDEAQFTAESASETTVLE